MYTVNENVHDININNDRLMGRVVSVFQVRFPHFYKFKSELDLEWGPPSLMRTIE